MRCQGFFIGNGYDVQRYRFIGNLLIKVEFVLMVSLLGKFVDGVKLFCKMTKVFSGIGVFENKSTFES